MAVFRVEKTKDYTVMSNHHLRNKDLSLKAKGMLSLMLSLPENWDYTLAGLAYICKDGIASIRTTILELEENGYLTRRRLRNEKGQLGDTEYIIHEQPQACGKPVDNSVDNSDKQPICENQILDNPILDNPTLGKPILEKPILENHTQLNTNQLIKEKLNTDGLNIYQSIPQEKPYDSIDEIDKFHKYRELIMNNIEYDVLTERYGKYILDEIVETMLDAICGKRESVKISGTDFPAEVVKSRLLKLDASHIEYICYCINKNTTKIGNIKAYLLTTLYNAPATIDHFYKTQANHDIANWQKNN